MRTTKRLCAFLLAVVMVIAGGGLLTTHASAITETTVTFMADGKVIQTKNAYIGNPINVPNAAVDFEGWLFLGWVEQPLASTQQEPTFYAPGVIYDVTTFNPVLYALYKRVDEVSDFQPVTSTTEITPGVYVISSARDTSMFVMTGVPGSVNLENALAGVRLCG